jgi:hypothetical protein
MDEVLAIERRRRNLRIVLFVIILATLPFYCAGFLLWATAERGGATAPIGGTATATYTPISIQGPATRTLPGIITPLPFGTATSINPLQPTPGQFIPVPVTRFLSPTAIFLPTLTAAPTLTPFPTLPPLPTLAPATFTPIPTLAPPTAVPLPTLPPPTAEPPTPLPFPTDTPFVVEPPTATPG